MVEGLALTASQRQQIRAIQAETFTPAVGQAGGRPVRPEPPARALKQILDILTPEQRAAWREIVGAAFGTPSARS